MHLKKFLQHQIVYTTLLLRKFLVQTMINNATNATVFYNSNAAPIMPGWRIPEKAKETGAKVLFSKFRFSTTFVNLSFIPQLVKKPNLNHT